MPKSYSLDNYIISDVFHVVTAGAGPPGKGGCTGYTKCTRYIRYTKCTRYMRMPRDIQLKFYFDLRYHDSQ